MKISTDIPQPGCTRPGARAALALALATLGTAAAVQAQVASINGQIAYTQCEESSIPFSPDQCDIWVMNSDGSGQTNLTNTTDRNEVGPAWSPDGLRIAFFEGWSTYTLNVMNADGSNMTAHSTSISTPRSAAPAWSPGGTQLAFQASLPDANGGTRAEIVAFELASGTETVVSPPVDFGGGLLLDAEEIEPAWSPDGGRIAYASVRPEWYADPVTGEPQEGAQWEIVIVEPDGSGEVVVSAGDAGTDRANFLEEDRAPAWSPDGSQLAFMSQAQVPSCCGPWQIWVVNRDGTGAINLTNDDSVFEMGPAWSPDGTQITFSRSNGDGTSDIYARPAPVPPAPANARAGITAMALAPAVVAEPVRLTFGTDAADPDWGRNPELAPVVEQFSLYTKVTPLNRGADGIIASRPNGIWCGTDCDQSYTAGTSVSVTAVPRQGSVFAGWSGACSGRTRPCTVTMNDVKSVKAFFKRVR